MISILSTRKKKFRTFGWVQDPSNLISLCSVVAVFDPNSLMHEELVEHIIPNLVEERDGREEFIKTLKQKPLRIPYAQLVGTSFKPRSCSRCNGIIQATVKGQGKDFIGDWPADNFVRWAHCFGFIKYNYADDTFEITEEGLTLSAAKKNESELSEAERHLLTNAVLAYAPAIRILKLLSATEDTHLTKFELGKQLGFIGEDGFTSMPQKILIQALADAETPKEKNSMKADWEGSSDKYARMISSWLEKLGLVKKVPKSVSVTIAKKDYCETIGQSYMITAAGITALRRAEGKSKHKRIAKNICWEMMATSCADRDYLRTRRSYILKYLSESKTFVTTEDIKCYLKEVGLEEQENTIIDDIVGLINIGIEITVIDSTFKFNDKIKDFVIPLTDNIVKSDLSTKKDEVCSKMNLLSHEYLSLIDLAYDSRQNRLFEMKTLELLTEECGFEGLHLGGSRKPDGIIYTRDLDVNYGVIIDTKAYSNGYNLPISQADEMERYIGENQTRDEKINPNKWWEHFDSSISTFYFMFVSGHFKGKYKSQLERISANKHIDGTAIAVINLLLLVEFYKSGRLSQRAIASDIFNNGEYTAEMK